MRMACHGDVCNSDMDCGSNDLCCSLRKTCVIGLCSNLSSSSSSGSTSTVFITIGLVFAVVLIIIMVLVCWACKIKDCSTCGSGECFDNEWSVGGIVGGSDGGCDDGGGDD